MRTRGKRRRIGRIRRRADIEVEVEVEVETEIEVLLIAGRDVRRRTRIRRRRVRMIRSTRGVKGLDQKIEREAEVEAVDQPGNKSNL